MLVLYSGAVKASPLYVQSTGREDHSQVRDSVYRGRTVSQDACNGRYELCRLISRYVHSIELNELISQNVYA